MALFEKALEAGVMSTKLLVRADVSKKILLEAHGIATAFEARYSAYRRDSFLNRVNAAAGRERVACSEADRTLFARCIEASRRSGGAFDITIGAVSHGAYRFGFSDQELPSEQTIARRMGLVGYEMIALDAEGIFLPKAGMRLDLGGIGKGYVAGLIARFLEARGATKALVNVGGEIVTFGKRYTIALKNPFAEGNTAYLRTSCEPLSVSTSGDYERFIGSREHHHILHRGSGRPPAAYSSMTVLRNGFDIDLLDAYATAMFSMDRESILALTKPEGIATIIIDRAGDLQANNLDALRFDRVTFPAARQ